MRSSLVRLALAVSLVAGQAEGQSASGLEPLIRSELSSLDAIDGSELGKLAIRLNGLAGSDNRAALEEVLTGLLGDDALNPAGRLAVAAAYLQGDDPDPGVVHSALGELLDSSDPAAVAEAAGLYANPLFRGLNERAELLQSLLGLAQDGAHTPEVRRRAAVAAYGLGRGSDRRAARSELLEFLDSSDPELRSRGALALASIGEEPTGRLERELEQLAALPGDIGDTARAHLKRQEYQRWSERKYRELQRRYQEETLPDELAQFNATLQMVENYHLDGDKVTRGELLDAALDGMLGALDQHSSYMGSETYSRFFQDLEAGYGGIGAYVNVDQADGIFTVTRPIYSGPAYEAGLMSDDKIVQIDDWPTLGETSDDIIKRLKGRPGTSAKLYIWRRGMDPALIDRPTEDMVVEVTRDQIEIPSVKVDLLPGQVGLVELSDFSRVASKEVREGLEQLKKQGMRSVVLDLRRNSGGLLPEAVKVTDLFLDPGKLVVSTESRVYTSNPHDTRTQPIIPTDMPVTVLIDRFTASAAEIVSGALRDHKRAELIGERSFGKGSVQDLIPVDGQEDDEFADENGNGRFDNWEKLTRDYDGDGEFDFAPRVKMTIARYLLPSGQSIHRELDEDRNILSLGGIEPDRNVAQANIEYWMLEEFRRLRGEGVFKEYVNDRWEQHQDTFRDLAKGDRKDPRLYPDFEEFRDSLATTLPDDEVRYLMRQAVRRRVQDDRGAEFPMGDYEEDLQLQEAIRVNLSALGDSYEKHLEYAATFEESTLDAPDTPIAQIRPRPTPDQVAESQALLLRARDAGEPLTREQLDELLKVLSRLEPETDR